ncbi:hypothetical protein Y032_0273g989 [Ancylostoma ceylanicum]|uniref:Peptidase M12A domain-containing protein n=1 Tax=Ancylostoma ceylanicum TaxID=53326 RepID=A0A016S8V2_9BILA|nr:hypothetical protein Y032_0273g989 [Ancylostoma ceylanicum]
MKFLLTVLLFVEIEAHALTNSNPETHAGDVGKLYEGDILLTPEQEADFTNAVRGEASIEPRQKRHAYRGKDYPTNTWGEKVYYQFDIHASQTLKDEFKRAAMAWQQDTCIDFEEETREHNRSIFKWGIHYEPNGGSRFTYRHPIVGLRLPAKLCRDPSPKYM